MLWVTTTDDDVFNDSKTATMASVDESNPEQYAFLFDCGKDELSFSYSERAAFPGELDGQLLVKIDGNKVITLDAKTHKRNDEYSEIISTDKDKILQIINQAEKAKNKITVGMKVGDAKTSYGMNLYKSATAVKKFKETCNIK
jgi:hypothetical protein